MVDVNSPPHPRLPAGRAPTLLAYPSLPTPAYLPQPTYPSLHRGREKMIPTARYMPDSKRVGRLNRL